MKRTVILHPIIIGLYPAIALYLGNYQSIQFRDTIPSMLVIIAAVLGIWWLLNKWIKNIPKSALLTSIFFLFFFMYGHVMPAISVYLNRLFDIQESVIVYLHTRGPMLFLLGIMALLFMAIAYLTLKSKSDFQVITQFMNVASVVLAALAIIQISTLLSSDQAISEQIETQKIQLEQLPQPGDSISEKPDIYYIILDGYARSDSMLNLYGYDNSDFIDYLHQKGFYVAEEATSNYNYTYLSLASSLNMQYLDLLADRYEPEETNVLPIVSMLNENVVMQFLNQIGYQLIYFPSGYSRTAEISVDSIEFPPNELNSFQDQLVNLTPLRFLIQKKSYDAQRQRVLYPFEQLPKLGENLDSKFMFAHILAPHPPFVFYSDGSPFTPDWEFMLNDGEMFTEWIGTDTYLEHYHQQAIFITHLTENLIEQLLARDPKPIVILQADHGPGAYQSSDNIEKANLAERFQILNAYYFPDGNYQQLYPSISPVNSFRVVFNQYFNTHYSLLPDKNYWIPENYPYAMIEVTDQVNP